jgi:putative ABC transport system substrate-binding protein
MFNNDLWVEAGGLLSYGPNFIQAYRRIAEMIGMILNGARPADMPVEQPTAFDMALNLRTARTLRLTIPASIRLRADRVIE